MSGIGENDTLDIRFNLYDVATDGDSLWAMTVVRIPEISDPTSAPFYSIVGLCRALIYKIEVKRLSVEEDEFADDSWVRRCDVLKLKDETE